MMYPSKEFPWNNANNLCKENNCMVERVSIMVLRVAALLTLILGILFWTNVRSPDSPLGLVHMLSGIIITLCLWILGILIATTKGGNVSLGASAIVLGIVVVVFGLSQT